MTYNGKKLRHFPKTCVFCQKQFWLPKYMLHQRFCSLSCRDKGTSNKVEVDCALCAKRFKMQPSKLRNSRTGLRFCGRECKEKATSESHVNEKFAVLKRVKTKDVASYRIAALRVYGPRCAKCGYDKKAKMLDVDHIDSNRKNNALSNLQVLCVWCHAEKTRANWPDEYG